VGVSLDGEYRTFNQRQVLAKEGESLGNFEEHPYLVEAYLDLIQKAEKQKSSETDLEKRLGQIEAEIVQKHNLRNRADIDQLFVPGQIIAATDPRVGGVLIQCDPSIWQGLSDEDR